MNRALLVASREYLENVKTKGFWIGILMMPIMLLLFALVPVLIESNRAAKTYAVIDEQDLLASNIETEITVNDLALYLGSKISDKEKTPLDNFKVKYLKASDAEGYSLSRTQFRGLARFLLTESGTVTKPRASNTRWQDALNAEQIRAVTNKRKEIQDWWRALSLERKAKLNRRISSNHFIRYVDAPTDQAALNKLLNDGSLFAYFIIEADPIAGKQAQKYVSNNLTDRDLLNWYSEIATAVTRIDRLNEKQINPDTSEWITRQVEFEGLQIKEDGLETVVDTEAVIRQWTPVVFVYLLWISILINTHMLLTNTVEEKSNKLIEVLLSSISPITLMAGKIIGIAATGLTIIFSWAAMAVIFLVILPSLAGFKMPLDITSAIGDPLFLLSFLVYFVLGYLLYAALLVGLGSVCNNLKEAQNLMLPVQLVQMLPIMLMIPIGRDPNGTLAQVLSYIPPLTPFVMMNRAAGPPTSTEYVVTTLLLVASIIAALWFGAKIFRIGILMTGKTPSLKQIWLMLRVPVTASGD